MTFPYPTVGIPQPGSKFNMTRVEKKDLSIFGEEINRLMMPYNVKSQIFRIQTANLRNGGNPLNILDISLSVKIIFP